MKKEFNYGIALLRIWMSFEVVVVHYLWNTAERWNLVERVKWEAVPVFVVIAFVFWKPENSNKQLKRLLYPYFTWTIVLYCVEQLFYCCKIGIGISPQELFWQLVTGYAFIPPYWYVVAITSIIILWTLIYKITKKEHIVYITVVIMAICYILEYSELNYRVFTRIARITEFARIDCSWGRIIELIPYSCIGILLSMSISRKKVGISKRISVQLVLILIILLSFKENSSAIISGFGYGGIQHLLISVLVFSLFEKLDIKSELLKRIVRRVSRYSFGVYCIHWTLGKYLEIFVGEINSSLCGSFYACLLIYFASLGLCHILYSLWPKFFGKLVM